MGAKDNFQVDLDAFKYPTQQGTGAFNLGAIYEGEFESHFKGKTIPTSEDAQDTSSFIESGKSKLVVFSNEEFLSNDFVNREDELFVVLNTLDYLMKDGSLIKIRNKSKFSRPLNKALNQAMFTTYKNFIIAFTTFFVPILFIIMGFIVSLIRKKKYKLIEEKYNAEEKDGK